MTPEPDARAPGRVIPAAVRRYQVFDERSTVRHSPHCVQARELQRGRRVMPDQARQLAEDYGNIWDGGAPEGLADRVLAPNLSTTTSNPDRAPDARA